MEKLLHTKFYIMNRHIWRERENLTNIWPLASVGFEDPDTDGVTRAAFNIWLTRPKTEVREESIVRLCNFINTVLFVPHELRPEHFSPATSLEEFCTVIGYSNGDMLSTLYEILFRQSGPTVDSVYENIQASNKNLSRVEGFYNLYRLEPKDLGGKYTRMGLAVVTQIPFSHRRDDPRQQIVCRMSIPAIGQKRHFLYIGIISVAPRFLSWLFRQEDESYGDLVFVVIPSGNPMKKPFQRKGVMATMGQDDEFLPISYKIIVEKVKPITHDHLDIDTFLEKAAESNLNREDTPFDPKWSANKKNGEA